MFLMTFTQSLANNTSHTNKGGMTGTTGAGMVGGEELKVLKDQISALRDGLRQVRMGWCI